MKFSFTTLTTPNVPLEQVAKMARRYGYDGVDIRVSNNNGELTINSSGAEVREIRELFASEGVAIPSLLCYPEVCPDVFTEATQFCDWLKRHIQLGEQANVKSLRLFTHNAKTWEEHADSYLNAFAQSLNKVMTEEKTSLNLVIQNHWMYTSAAQTLQIVEQANHAQIQPVFSPDHCILTGENTDAIYSRMMERIGQLYIADLKREGDGFTWALPGEGLLEGRKHFAAALENGFDGFVTFKWYLLYYPQLADATVALPHFIEYAKRLLN